MSARETAYSEAISYLFTFANVNCSQSTVTIPLSRWTTFKKLVAEADAEPTTPPPPAPEAFYACAFKRGACVEHGGAYVTGTGHCDATPPAQEAGAPTPCAPNCVNPEHTATSGIGLCVYGPPAPEKTKPPLCDFCELRPGTLFGHNERVACVECRKGLPNPPEKTKPPAEDAETLENSLRCPEEFKGRRCEHWVAHAGPCKYERPRPSKSPGGGR